MQQTLEINDITVNILHSICFKHTTLQLGATFLCSSPTAPLVWPHPAQRGWCQLEVGCSTVGWHVSPHTHTRITRVAIQTYGTAKRGFHGMAQRTILREALLSHTPDFGSVSAERVQTGVRRR